MTHPETVLNDLDNAIQTALQTSSFATPRLPCSPRIPFRPPICRPPVSTQTTNQIFGKPPIHGSPMPVPLTVPGNIKASEGKTFMAPPKLRNRKVSRQDVIKALMFMEGGSLQKELNSLGLDISAPGMIYRRKQISPALFDDILTAFNATAPAPETFYGWRVVAVDGTAVNICYNKNSPCLVRHASAPDGYCQIHATPLYDVLNKQYLSCVLQPQPKQDEIGALDFMLTWYDFDETMLIVADRAFSSYNLFATLQEAGVDFLIRIKNQRGAMREVAKLAMEEIDTEISFTITTENTKEAREKGWIWVQTRKNENRTYSEKTRAGRWDHPSPYPMKLRIVRLLLESGEYENLATSLPPSVTPAQIKELYHARRGIEQAFAELKYTFGLDYMHGKSWEFACQEIMANIIAANVCSRILKEVAIKQNPENKYGVAINRKMAVNLIKKFLRTPGADGDQLMRDIARYTVPIRPGRKDERKLKPKTFRQFVFRVPA